MIEFNITPNGLVFTLSHSREVPFAQWQGLVPKYELQKIHVLTEFIQNGQAHEVDGEVHLDPNDIYPLDREVDDEETVELERHLALLGLPEIYGGDIFLSSKSRIEEASFRIEVTFCRVITDIGPKNILGLTPRLNLLVDDSGSPVHTLSLSQYRLIKRVQEQNSLSEKAKNARLNLTWFDSIREAAETAGARFDTTLRDQRVHRVTKLGIHFEHDENGALLIEPTVYGSGAEAERDERDQQFAKRFHGVRNTRDVYTINGPSGTRERIPVNDKQKNVLEKLKAHGKITDPAEQARIGENPRILESEYGLDSNLIDLSAFYSDRVIEVGLYKPKVYPFITQYQSEWVPGFVIEDRVNGQQQIFIRTDEDLQEFRDAIQSAETAGHDELDYGGSSIGVREANDLADAAEAQLSNRQEPVSNTDKNVLIIKENADLLEYEDEHNLSNVEHRFQKVEGLRDEVTLKRHQEEGIAWFQSLFRNKARGCLLADDMGLGKTLQTIYFLEWLKSTESNPVAALIVAPVSLLENWRDEYGSFFPNSSYEMRSLYGNHEFFLQLREDIENAGESVICFISYEGMRKHQLALAAVNWTVIVTDEAQKIKTPGRMVTNAAKALKADFRIALTGTPVENSFYDLWCIMDFCVPGLLGSAKQFGKKFRTGKNDSPDEITRKGNELRKQVGVYFKRRIKSDVLRDLPALYSSEADENKDEFEGLQLKRVMPEAQLQAYSEAVAEVKQSEEDSVPARKGAMLQYIHKIRRISDHPWLDTIHDHVTDIDEVVGASARAGALIDILDRVHSRGEKVLIFSEFLDTQFMLNRIVEDRFGIKPSVINGATPTNPNRRSGQTATRQETIKAFTQSRGFAVIIMSPVAAGIGLNVAAANHVIHYSRHWNPAKESQATDRAYRIGQTREVFVYYPKCTLPNEHLSFDEVLSQLLSQKRRLASASLYPSEQAEIKPYDLLTSL